MTDDERTAFFVSILHEAGIPHENHKAAMMDLIFVEGMMRVLFGKAVGRDYLVNHCKDNHRELAH